MVSSGIALVTFDSRVIQRSIRKVENLFRRATPAHNVELGEITTQGDMSPETRAPSVREDTAPVVPTHDITSSLRNRQARPQENADPELDYPQEEPTARVRAEDVAIPYSIRTGFVIFVFFVVSFIVTMAVHGAVSDSPLLFEFYANMYLAGSSFPKVPSNCRNNHIRYYLLSTTALILGGGYLQAMES